MISGRSRTDSGRPVACAAGIAILDGRNAAEARSMIVALAVDETGSRPLADGALTGERDLARGIDRFRSRFDEDDAVETSGRDFVRAPTGFARSGQNW